jgi:hypothetical protein
MHLHGPLVRVSIAQLNVILYASHSGLRTVGMNAQMVRPKNTLKTKQKCNTPRWMYLWDHVLGCQAAREAVCLSFPAQTLHPEDQD